MNIYVAYEDGVYRHKTISVGYSEESLINDIIKYFKGTDDYHQITVEVLDPENSLAEELCVFTVKSERNLKVRMKHQAISNASSRIHGDRVVYKDGVEFCRWFQEYQLKDYEEIIECR